MKLTALKNQAAKIRVPRNIWILFLIWLGGVVCDRIWWSLDEGVPGWDQADYLTGTLNYGAALSRPEWGNGDWWRNLWLLSSKIPPLTYMVAGVLQNFVGVGVESATIIMSLYSGVLLAAVYGLGWVLFDGNLGLLAAGLCQIIPGLYRLRLDFLLDYPLAAMVALCFLCVTLWHFSGTSFLQKEAKSIGNTNLPKEGDRWNDNPKSPIQNPKWYKSLGLAISCGITFALALLTKQTAVFFLLVPIVWSGATALFSRHWLRVGQFLLGVWVATWIFMPWYRTNWLLILTSGKRASIDSAIAEGDPPLNTLAAWTFYWEQLPHQLSFPLLVMPLVGLIIYGWHCFRQRKGKSVPHEGLYATQHENNSFPLETGHVTSLPHSSLSSYKLDYTNQNPNPHQNTSKSLRWLALFLIASYLLSSVNINKDDRYIIPYLPSLTIILAYGLTRIKSYWWRNLRLTTLILTTCLTLINLFPLPGAGIAQIFAPHSQHYPYQGAKYPHTAVIAEIMRTQPYLRSTVAVLPSTPDVNQHNLNYYGAISRREGASQTANFQVYGRQVATNRQYLERDIAALDWFITKTGNQGSVRDIQAEAVSKVETSPDLQLHKTWQLPDGESLKLYHRIQPATIVTPINPPPSQVNPNIELIDVKLPDASPGGVPIPITYTWQGNLQAFHDGVMLLTWRRIDGNSDNSNNLNIDQQQWFHDHSIGMGDIYPRFHGNMYAQVRDRTAMSPPQSIAPGKYTLEATYLHRQTQATYTVKVPNITIEINPQVPASAAPEPDLASQFRQMAATMPQGISAFENIFAEIGRINQYDPTQDYLQQVLIASQYRLQQQPQNRELAYTVALSNVLLRRVEDAIASLEYVTKIDSQNPFAWGYLAFVHLYNWHPQAAETALKPALELNPHIRELQALSGVAALFQGKFIAAYRDLSGFLTPRRDISRLQFWIGCKLPS